VGKKCDNKFKLVFLGSEGAGNISPTYSLSDKDFEPSTFGADLNTCTVDRILASK